MQNIAPTYRMAGGEQAAAQYLTIGCLRFNEVNLSVLGVTSRNKSAIAARNQLFLSSFVSELNYGKDTTVKPIVTAVAFSLITGTAFAQGMTETTTTITISPADETEMRDYIVREHRAAIPPPPGFTVTNGVALPGSIDLYSFPASRPWAQNYEYTVIGDQPVLVDPVSRRIVHIFH
jgi:hypothetical protein